MKFEEVYGRSHRGGLSQAEAEEVLGVSERTFRRWRDRYEAEGADGLYDRRLGRDVQAATVGSVMGTPSLSGAMDSSVMYLLETAHSSFCSRRMAPTSRVMAASLGKISGNKNRRRWCDA